MNIKIRKEKKEDETTIENIIIAAYKNVPNSNKREAEIVSRLRNDSELTVSMVAELDKQIVGHIAFSEILINDEFIGWYSLSPLSVLPAYQKKGVGTKLIRKGIKSLEQIHAHGCAVVGSSDYLEKFGFKIDPCLTLEGIPSDNFLVRSFHADTPFGTAIFHQSFANPRRAAA